MADMERERKSLNHPNNRGDYRSVAIGLLLLLAAVPSWSGISVTERAALKGTLGIEVASEGTGAAYGMMNSKPANYPEIHAYFWFDKATTVLAPGNWIRVASLTDASGTDLAAFEFRFDGAASEFKWRGVALDGGTAVYTDEGIVDSTIDGYLVALQWRSSATGDGMFQVLAHGQAPPALQGLDNDYTVRTVRLGALAGTVGMAAGTWYAIDDLRLYSDAEPVGAMVEFVGVASDAEDGDLSDAIAWESDIDGPIFTGNGPELSILSPGVHVITATVTDSSGLSDSDQSTAVEVVMTNDPPEVFILSPAPGSNWGN